MEQFRIAVRAVVMGGYLVSPGAAVNTIEYVEISTLGNAIDFGDLSTASI